MLPPEQKVNQQLANRIGVSFMERFGSSPDSRHCRQIRREWNAMMRSRQAAELWLLSELARVLRERNCPVYRTAGKSMLLDLIGLPEEEGNLPARNREQYVQASLSWPGDGHPAEFHILLPVGFYTEFRDTLSEHWCHKLCQPAILEFSDNDKTIYEQDIHITFGNLKFYFQVQERKRKQRSEAFRVPGADACKPAVP